MRKISFVLAAVAVTGLTVVAKAAPESTYFFDIRPTTGAITTPANPFLIGQGDFPDDGGAGGGKGNGQVLRICPVISNGAHLANSYPNFDNDNNAATGDLFLYADVGDDAGAVGTGDVISSVGLDMAVATSVATPRYDIATINWSWTLTDASSPVNYGFAAGTSSRTGVVGAKYVKVPVDGASLYATAGGLTPGSFTQLGRMAVVAAARNVDGTNCAASASHATNSTYNVNLSVNNLLITRTFSNVVADVEERVSFGYTGGAVEADVSGNTVGGAGVRDAVIQVRLKHDGNSNGFVNTLDLGGANGFNTAQTAGTNINQRQRYLYDRNNSGNVNTLDLGGAQGFNAFQSIPCN